MHHTSDGISIDHGVVAILHHEDRVVLPGGLVEAGELIAEALIAGRGWNRGEQDSTDESGLQKIC